MKVYIDNDCKCYTAAVEGLREFDVPLFDGKCDTFIEGYRFVPAGENWTREDGEVFQGEMIAPWKPFDELDAAQREYEQELLRDALNALSILGVNA
jgi:hypothetical protein